MKVTTDGCFFGAVIQTKPKTKVLDIGTGTGLLSLMLAQRAPYLQIDAIEIDEAAYLQASQNFANSPWSEQLRAHHLPLQAFKSEEAYDLIICNPPFFKQSQTGNKANKNKALHAIDLSMDDLANYAHPILQPDGELWVMYPQQEMAEFVEIAKNQGFFPKYQTRLRNTSEAPVFRDIIGFGKNEADSNIVNDRCIRDETGTYTKDFQELLKPYYLHF